MAAMEKYFHKLHEHRCRPGLERAIWRKLPFALAGCVLVPLGISLAARLCPPDGPADQVAKATMTVDFFAVGLGLTSLIALLTVAIGCVLVMIMKGPAYVADAYHLEVAEEPPLRTGKR